MNKKTYLVGEGVAVVNGALVPVGRLVRLSDREAMFDLAQGRIELQRRKRAPRLKACGN